VNDWQSFEVTVRFDTDVELLYFRHGGILNYMIRQMLWACCQCCCGTCYAIELLL